MSRICHNPPDLFNSLVYGFSQIVEIKGNRILHISGQTAWDSQEAIVGTTRRAQMFQCLKNIETALLSTDCTLDDIASLRIYMVKYKPEEAGMVSDVLKEFFPINPPATTWVGVEALAQKAYLIEIEAMAVVQ